MTFYTLPPAGMAQLSHLESWAHKRLQFLIAVQSCHGNTIQLNDLLEQTSTVEDCECLLEGTKKDVVSHFVLRLACCQDPDMARFLVNSETQLFKYRLSCFNYKELLSSLRTLKKLQRQLKHSQKLLSKDNHHLLSVMNSITQNYDWTQIAKMCSSGSEDHFIQVPFQYATHLVASRSVVLERGRAFVPCSKLGEVLEGVFEGMLVSGMKLAHKQWRETVQDERMKRLFLGLKARFRQLSRPDGPVVPNVGATRCEDIDSLSNFFPPCMNHLHNVLRRRHRLKHFSRIQYTLFLKEVGLPANEAIHFWRQEFSQIGHGSEGGCDHTWERDGRRYVYNIRHLYGLEGSRVNYRGHCCQSIQNMAPGPKEEGGCPFVHFDREHLQQILKTACISHKQQKNIYQHVESMDYSAACTAYFEGTIQSLRCHSAKSYAKSWKDGNASGCLDKNEITLSGLSSMTSDFSGTITPLPHENLTSGETDSVHQSACIKILHCQNGNCTSVDNVASAVTSQCTQGGCYEHDICPSSQLESSKHHSTGLTQSEQILFHKPLDFYLSYKNLVKGFTIK